jgi:hypothetical protein
MAPGVGLHAVLVVETDHGDFVLDNLQDEPRAATSLGYVWLSRQAGADITHWTAVRPTDANAHAQIVDLSAEDMFHRVLAERAGRAAAAPAPATVPSQPGPQPQPLGPDPVAPIAPMPTIAEAFAQSDDALFTSIGFADAVDLTPAGLRRDAGEQGL